MLPTKFRFIWPSGFREDFFKSANQKQELPVAAMFINGSGRNEQSLLRTFHRCFLPSFSSFGKEEKIKMWKVNQRRMPNDGKSSLCLWQGELKIGEEKKSYWVQKLYSKYIILSSINTRLRLHDLTTWSEVTNIWQLNVTFWSDSTR